MAVTLAASTMVVVATMVVLAASSYACWRSWYMAASHRRPAQRTRQARPAGRAWAGRLTESRTQA